MKTRFAVAIAFGAALACQASAQDFVTGYDAYAVGDYATAHSIWLPLGEQGNAVAQYNLGLMSRQGFGVPQDDAEAVRWYRLAADQGHAFAQYNVGFMYRNGLGVPQDNAEAVRWYRLAADQSYAFAQGNLGFMYRNGLGVPRDNAEAVRWYRLAADQGNANAQFNLGVMFENGHGVLQNYALAHMWYNISSANGFDDAAVFRDDLVTRMTPEQVADAQERARVCMGSGYRDCD
jgi:TPR repeat protein